ncbi:hypothetical protein MW887_001236 [Aspergillus wentii]|nr:hypothetical protein MW887_001236 [Aspergillus wentii]
MVCYCSNTTRNNFPVDRNGQAWVVDFGPVGVIPGPSAFALNLIFRDHIFGVQEAYTNRTDKGPSSDEKGVVWWFLINCGSAP